MLRTSYLLRAVLDGLPLRLQLQQPLLDLGGVLAVTPGNATLQLLSPRQCNRINNLCREAPSVGKRFRQRSTLSTEAPSVFVSLGSVQPCPATVDGRAGGRHSLGHTSTSFTSSFISDLPAGTESHKVVPICIQPPGVANNVLQFASGAAGAPMRS